VKTSERDAQHAILECARLNRWAYAHFGDSRRQIRPGVFVGDRQAKGWPDLALCRERLVVAELKSVRGKPSWEQCEWLDRLALAGVECYLWTINDLQEIQKILQGRWRYLPRGDRTSMIGRSQDEPCLATAGSAGIVFRPGSLWLSGEGRMDSR